MDATSVDTERQSSMVTDISLSCPIVALLCSMCIVRSDCEDGNFIVINSVNLVILDAAVFETYRASNVSNIITELSLTKWAMRHV